MTLFVYIHLYQCEQMKETCVYLAWAHGSPRGHGGMLGAYSLEPDGRLLQVIDVKEPPEKDIQTRSKNNVGP